MESVHREETSSHPRGSRTRVFAIRAHVARSAVTDAFVADAPSPRFSKAVLVVLVRWFLKVALGLAYLDAYLRSVSFVTRAAGVAVNPLVIALVLLTVTLCAVPERSAVARFLTKTLKPAVDAVDKQLACVFIPYVAALPVSNLPAGGGLWTAAAVCAAGTLATMFVAGNVAQTFAVGNEHALRTRGGGAEGDRPESKSASEDATAKSEAKAIAAAARALLGGTPAAFAWFVATLASVPFALMPRGTLSFATMAGPAYACATAMTFALAKKVPSKFQRFGLVPTVVGGVAVACLAGLVGTVTGAGAETGVRDYLLGAGAFYLYFVPSAVLGLAFRIKANADSLARNAIPIAAAIGVAVPGGLLFAAALGSACGLPVDVVLASLPKCTTTGLAVHMAETLGVDPSLAAAGCTLSATIGLSAGRSMMDALKLRSAVARGVATGSSSHAAGTVALAAAGEDAAAAVSGVVFALSGVLGVLLIEIPWFRRALISIAGAA